jgi:glycosyltransferase involved in cell wall biosynthesis
MLNTTEESSTDLISFSNKAWCDQPWKTRNQISSRLTPWFRILFVEEPFYIRQVLSILGRKILSNSGMEIIRPNLIRYRPPKYLPYNYRFKRIEHIFQYLRIAHLQSVCRKIRIKKPVLMLWDPEFYYKLGHFDESLRCYFTDDQYSLFSGTDAVSAARTEEVLLKQVDMVFCTSEPLCEDKKRFNSNVHLIPNGVDYERFAAAASSQYSVPVDLQQIQRPILGFTGNVDDRLDCELLLSVANDNPTWSVVLIGPNNIYTPQYRAQFNKLLACKNVKWLGLRAMELIPAYLQGMDACAIVNRINEFARFLYPIKLHEYLAAGKPIISTGIPSVMPFEGVIHIANSPEEWKKSLRQTLAETGRDWVERQQAIAREHT